MGLKAEAPDVHRVEELQSYFENTWLNGSYPISIWNYYKVDAPRTKNHIEGWHGKINRVASKSHSNIFWSTYSGIIQGWASHHWDHSAAAGFWWGNHSDKKKISPKGEEDS